MTRVNKKNIDAALKREAWQRLLSALSGSRSADGLIAGFGTFMTSAELTMIEKRLLIPVLLERGMTYRAIGEAIDVSANTISFVKHRMKRRPQSRRENHYVLPRKREEEPGILMSPREHLKYLHRKSGF